jgi:hypothetical protein
MAALNLHPLYQAPIGRSWPLDRGRFLIACTCCRPLQALHRPYETGRLRPSTCPRWTSSTPTIWRPPGSAPNATPTRRRDCHARRQEPADRPLRSVAGHRDGELGPRSVLVGDDVGRGRRDPGRAGRDRGHLPRLSRADGQGPQRVYRPPGADPRRPARRQRDRQAGHRRGRLRALPPDPARRSRRRCELHRRLRRQAAATDLWAAREPLHHADAEPHRLHADEGRSRDLVGDVWQLPHAADRDPRTRMAPSCPACSPSRRPTSSGATPTSATRARRAAGRGLRRLPHADPRWRRRADLDPHRPPPGRYRLPADRRA